MDKLTHNDLMPLETYHRERPEFRQTVLAHKAQRQVALGEHATLYFEDRLTIQYQIQEMLRVERIFEAEAIGEELEAYNPLIPDGDNLKATFMIEYDDVDERRQALERLVGIEDQVWIENRRRRQGHGDCRRRSGAQPRVENLGGALHAISIHAGHGCSRESGCRDRGRGRPCGLERTHGTVAGTGAGGTGG